MTKDNQPKNKKVFFIHKIYEKQEIVYNEATLLYFFFPQRKIIFYKGKCLQNV